jgi:hypothetical protein
MTYPSVGDLTAEDIDALRARSRFHFTNLSRLILMYNTGFMAKHLSEKVREELGSGLLQYFQSRAVCCTL